MPSLENQLETAYAAVAKANEPALAETAPRLSTLILAQAPNPDDQTPEPDVEQVPAPYVLLTAKRGEESIPHTGIFEMELAIEVGDNAQSASADGGALDALFSAAARPLFYKTLTDETTDPPTARTLFQVLTMAVTNFACFGMPRRANGTEMQEEGSIVKRIITATFLCQTTA